MTGLRLYLDDLRPTPDGWTAARSVEEAVRLVEDATASGAGFEAVSLDHDLGDFEPLGGDAGAFVAWMERTRTWPSRLVRIHTANPVGRAQMYDAVRHAVTTWPELFDDEFDVEVSFGG